ncbi:MAG: TIGR04282 family arsenosugar biosynthesis glycosyltransferase [Planctomycetaceae bacterium]
MTNQALESKTTLGLFAKQPIPGTVKTRLAAEIGDDAAAELYAAFTADLVDRFRRLNARRLLCITPADEASAAHFAVLAGDEYEIWPQPEGSLGTRLSVFFHRHLGPGERALVIGSDSPTLPVEYVNQAFVQLEHRDSVFGMALDGGYCLVGLRDAALPIFEEIEWSGPHVLDQSIARVERCGASHALLPPWVDVDTFADLEFLREDVRARVRHAEPIDLHHTLPLLGIE